MLKRIALITFAVAIIVIAIVLAVNNGSASKDDGPKTFPITRGEIVEKALAVGRIEPRKQVSVKSPISGLVRKAYVEVGDVVKVGDPLFDIKPDPTPVEYAEAKRQVELAQVSFDNSKREYDRAKSLRDQQLISFQDCESKQAAYDEAELRLKLAGEKLALLESGRTEIAGREIDNIIKASIHGTVLSLEVEEGDPVVPLTTYQSGTELMTLAHMDDLIFKGNVDEIDVGKLSPGMQVDMEIGALPNKKVTGVLRKVSPKAHQEEGATLFEVEADITDADGSFLRAGYSANANVMITKKSDILIAPERLIKFEDSVATCEVMDSTGEITSRSVKTGLSDGINIEITDGASEGELLVERPPKEITGE
jgi:HlyD family secretion protein